MIVPRWRNTTQQGIVVSGSNLWYHCAEVRVTRCRRVEDALDPCSLWLCSGSLRDCVTRNDPGSESNPQEARKIEEGKLGN